MVQLNKIHKVLVIVKCCRKNLTLEKKEKVLEVKLLKLMKKKMEMMVKSRMSFQRNVMRLIRKQDQVM